MKVRCLQVCAVLLLVLGPWPCRAARIAVVTDQPPLGPLVDQLTVAFSGLAGVELLEWAEIDRVLEEQRLSASGGRNFVELGRLRSADGLVLVQWMPHGSATNLATRLVAVESGAVIRLVDLDSFGLADYVAQQFEPWIARLALPPKDAVPVSLLNLRFSARRPGSDATEQVLTALHVATAHAADQYPGARTEPDGSAGS